MVANGEGEAAQEQRASKVTGGGAWYTGLNPSSSSAPATQQTGESEASLIETLGQLMEQLDLEPESSASTITDASSNTTKNDEEVFKATYIPFSLHEVDDPEREIELQKKAAPATTSTAAPQDLDSLLPTSNGTAEDGEESDESASGSGSEEEEGESVHPKDSKLSKEEARALKKQAKKETKEANREKRKTKMPKAEKKRRMNKGKK